MILGILTLTESGSTSFFGWKLMKPCSEVWQQGYFSQLCIIDSADQEGKYAVVCEQNDQKLVCNNSLLSKQVRSFIKICNTKRETIITWFDVSGGKV